MGDAAPPGPDMHPFSAVAIPKSEKEPKVRGLLRWYQHATAGNYVWRPAGSRHDAHSPNGAIVLSFFPKPNKFFDMGGGHIEK